MIPGGKLRIVIATTAFSMGIDCPDICNIIYYSPSTSTDQCVQEIGRAGCDGSSSTALLFVSKANQAHETKHGGLLHKHY